jgi:monoamine oxidase
MMCYAEAAIRAGFPHDSLSWQESQHFVYQDTSTETAATQLKRHLKIRNFILSQWKNRPTQQLPLATIIKRARSKVFSQYPQQVMQIYEFLVRHGHINVGIFSYDTTTSTTSTTSSSSSESQSLNTSHNPPPNPSLSSSSSSLSPPPKRFSTLLFIVFFSIHTRHKAHPLKYNLLISSCDSYHIIYIYMDIDIICVCCICVESEKEPSESSSSSVPISTTSPQKLPIKSSSARKPVRVLVVGAGAAGLSVARQLHHFNRYYRQQHPDDEVPLYEVTIFEARNRIGGRVRTEWIGQNPPVALDLGASIITGLIGNPLDNLYLQLTQNSPEGTTPLRAKPIGDKARLYTRQGSVLPSEIDLAMDKLFNELLEATSKLKDAAKDKSLGQEMDAMAPTLSRLERAVLDWYYANLEYACAADLSLLSVNHWDQDDPYEYHGDHLMLVDGYKCIIDAIAQGLDIRLNTPIQCVSYGERGVTLHTANDTTEEGDIAVITLPLGVLKEGTVRFDPPLPEWKTDAIKRLGFGLLNKVALRFPIPFWDTELDWFGVVDADAPREQRGEFYLFWNMYKFTQQPVLVALVAGKAGHVLEERTDTEILQRVMPILRAIFGKGGGGHREGIVEVPDPTDYIITRWKSEPYSRGTYSYIALGATGQDYDALARCVWLGGRPKLFWAGEASNRQHPATVAGAYQSGLREAEKIHRYFAPAVEFYSPPPFRNEEEVSGVYRTLPSALKSASPSSSTSSTQPTTTALSSTHSRTRRRGIVKSRYQQHLTAHGNREYSFKYAYQFQNESTSSENEHSKEGQPQEERYRTYGALLRCASLAAKPKRRDESEQKLRRNSVRSDGGAGDSSNSGSSSSQRHPSLPLRPPPPPPPPPSSSSFPSLTSAMHPSILPSSSSSSSPTFPSTAHFYPLQPFDMYREKHIHRHQQFYFNTISERHFFFPNSSSLPHQHPITHPSSSSSPSPFLHPPSSLLPLPQQQQQQQQQPQLLQAPQPPQTQQQSPISPIVSTFSPSLSQNNNNNNTGVESDTVARREFRNTVAQIVVNRLSRYYKQGRIKSKVDFLPSSLPLPSLPFRVVLIFCFL